MKRNILLILFLMVALATSAKRIDEQTALTVARNFWNIQTGSSESPSLANVSSRAQLRNLYLFEAASSNGFVVVAADDVAMPILGYSFRNTLSEQINAEALYWLRCLDEEIAYAQANGIEASGAVAQQWDEIVGGLWHTHYDYAVAPLVTTTWDQGSYYNQLCPSDAAAYSGGHCYTGCSATAMAQIMKKWNHPTTGTGSHSYYHSQYGSLSANFGTTTYQWSSMPTILNSSSSATQKNAVATLMYHCGVSIEMNYGPDGSGAQTRNYGNPSMACVENALMYYFGYKNTVHSIGRPGTSVSEWCGYLTDDLDNGRPVLYTGYDVTGAGHAFICDGYDNSGYFHFNWGWNGSCDGYYPISALNPSWSGSGGTPTGTYNVNQSALFGIEPLTSTSTTCLLTLNSSTGSGSLSGSGTYYSGDTATVMANAATGYRFAHWNDGSRYNPRYLFMNANTTLSPVCQSVHGDTLFYDAGEHLTSFGGTSSEWAVKFEPADFSGYTQLRKVMIYDASAGSYTINVYQGGTSSPSTLVATQSITLTGSNDWVTTTLATPVTLNTSQTLWITVSSSASYPAALSYYAGTQNSCLWKSGSSWVSVTSWGYYYSFMLRAVLNTNTSTQYTINAVPQSATMGSVTGGGSYSAGDNAVLMAHANNGYRFTQWNDGVVDNPRAITVSGNATYTAQYSSVGNDTLRYDNGSYETSLGAGGNIYWAVKFNGSDMGSHSSLSAIKIFDVQPGTYTVTIHQGGTNAPGSQIHSQNFTLQGSGSWVVVPTTAAVAVSNSQPLWIVIHNTGVSYPAACASYAGTDNSCYVSTDGSSWDALPSIDMYYSWMLRAVLGNGSVTTYTINATPQSSTMGSVAGGGSYPAGAEVVLTATANNGYRFTQWNDGVLDNPRTITVSGNANYTAQYSTVGTDMLQYDNGTYETSLGAGGDIYWAVKFNSTDLGSHTHLSAIKIFDVMQGSYTLTIHQGGTNAPGTQTASQTFSLSGSNNWATVDLTSPVQLNTNQALWIVVHNVGGEYPAAAAAYAGTTNSNYVSLDGASWSSLLEYDMANTWMLRAVLSNQQPGASYTIYASPADASMGSVSGGGVYEEGATVTLTATANNGYHFVRWNNNVTSNPYVFTATQNISLTAFFERDVDIDHVDATTITITPNPTTGRITIAADNLEKVELIDPMGRTLLTTGGATLDLSPYPAGCYMLRITCSGNVETHRVIKY